MWGRGLWQGSPWWSPVAAMGLSVSRKKGGWDLETLSQLLSPRGLGREGNGCLTGLQCCWAILQTSQPEGAQVAAEVCDNGC